jgi:hypothetical protein
MKCCFPSSTHAWGTRSPLLLGPPWGCVSTGWKIMFIYINSHFWCPHRRCSGTRKSSRTRRTKVIIKSIWTLWTLHIVILYIKYLLFMLLFSFFWTISMTYFYRNPFKKWYYNTHKRYRFFRNSMSNWFTTSFIWE